MRRIARFTRVPERSVFGVATFYAQFKFVPVGRNIVKVCRGTGCYVKGSPRLLEEFEKLLGIKGGETTPDMEYYTRVGGLLRLLRPGAGGRRQ